MGDGTSRSETVHKLEQTAELLVAHQLDLLAQLEAQLRAVHETMRRIESLRAARYRVGNEPSNGERRDILSGLSSELDAIEKQIQMQYGSCRDMHAIIRHMQQAVDGLRKAADGIGQGRGADAQLDV